MPLSPLLSITAADVLAFWREAGPDRWFRKDEAFDAEFRTRFIGAHEAAARGELDAWARDGAGGALALLILLDQFPRNAFRGTPRMFASDAKAREVARQALQEGFDTQVESDLRHFFYLPLVHSESMQDQDQGIAFARTLGDEPLRHAAIHRDIIEKFGRFPHRNAVLGRTNTPEEQRFLNDGGFGG
jgi:uncharacterized protein (DUF924 family)